MDFMIAFLSGILGGVAGGIILVRFRGRGHRHYVGPLKRGPVAHKSVAAFNDFLAKNALEVIDDALE